MASSLAFPTEAAPPARRLGSRMWLALALACAMVVVAMAALLVSRSSALHVRKIEVDGAGHLSRAEVVRRSEITKADNALWLDEGAAEARLTENVWVASAEVHVDLPWTVTIAVTERTPIAVLERGGAEVLVAADGTLLGSGRRAGLPVIQAPPAWIDSAGSVPVEGIASALEALPVDLRAAVHRIEVGSPRGLQIVLSDGIRISYGSARAFEQKARAIADVLAWIGTTGEQIRSVDVSAPSAPAVVPRG